jgi:succinyl-CoA synthetase beta subunit
MALDARILIDDSALGRQPEIGALQPIAAKVRLPFRENPEGGTIGLIGLGGGLNVTLMDWIADAGAKVAALVDIDDAVGAGQAEQGFAAALEMFDRHPQIRSILVNVITCGYRLDDIAAGLVAALLQRDAPSAKPTILHLRGNAMTGTPELLRAAGQVNSASLATAVAAVLTAAKG